MTPTNKNIESSGVDVILGLQWGDEGKGKIVDVLAPRYNMIARFQGGPNAGHTLEFDGEKYVLRSIPSGIFQTGKINLLGNGVVLDPILFREEAEGLAQRGHDLSTRLLISRKAHLILPTHRLLDAANELAKGGAKIGTTGKGIGPTYTDKVSRNGLRVGDLEQGFEEKYQTIRRVHLSLLSAMNYPIDSLPELEEQWMQAKEYLLRFNLCDGEFAVNELLQEGKQILAEGAQGSMLDVDFGSYPFVTSSNTVAAGCCIGLGVAPKQVGNVYGVFKAYCTRVGAGPFPTELHDKTGDLLCELGHEFGSVTGRKRRCGWIDLVALRYTIMLNGVTHLIMMKSDVMDTFTEIKACVAYEQDGKRIEHFPFSFDGLKPIYETLPGWQVPMHEMSSAEQFPEAFNAYLRFLEQQLGVSIHMVSVGPDRKQTITLG